MEDPYPTGKYPDSIFGFVLFFRAWKSPVQTSVPDFSEVALFIDQPELVMKFPAVLRVSQYRDRLLLKARLI